MPSDNEGDAPATDTQTTKSRTSRKSTLPGVTFDLSRQWNFANKIGAVAGIMGFDSSVDLRSFFDRQIINSLLEEYCRLRHRKWDLSDSAPKQDPSLRLDKLLSVATDKAMWPILIQVSRPKVDSSLVTPTQLPWVITVHICFRLITAAPEVFNFSRPLQRHFAPNDIARCHAMLSYYWKQLSSGGKETSSKTHNRVEAIHIPHINTARSNATTVTSQPANKSMTTGSGNTTAPMSSVDAAQMQLFAMTDEDANQTNDPANDSQATNLEPDKEPDKSTDIHHHVTSYLITNARNAIMRRPMTRDVLINMLTMLKKKANITSEEFVEPEKAIRELLWEQASIADAGENMGDGNQFLSNESAGARPPDYNTAAAYFELNPDEPKIFETTSHPFELKKWQVQGIKWMAEREENDIHGGVIADGCGTGKTTQTLAFIALAPNHQPNSNPGKEKEKETEKETEEDQPNSNPGKEKETEEETEKDQSQKPHYKPTLVLCPPAARGVWIDEYRARFRDALSMHVYHSTRKDTIDSNVREMIVEKDELATLLRGLDSSDPETARTIVLSTYPTWASRTNVPGGGQQQKPDTSSSLKAAAAAADTEEQHKNGDKEANEQEETNNNEAQPDTKQDELDEDDGEVQTENEKKQPWCKYAAAFDRIIADEAHSLKELKTTSHKVILSMKFKYIWFLTATPLMNRVKDMGGYLDLIWRDEFNDTFEIQEPDNDLVKKKSMGHGERLEALRAEYGAYPLEVLDRPTKPLHLLSPSWFRSFVVDGDISIGDCKIILPVLIRMFFLSRKMSHVVKWTDKDGTEQETRIGETIPPYQVATVELAMHPKQQKAHNECYFKLLKSMKQANSGDDGPSHLADNKLDLAQEGGTRDFRTVRRLLNLAFSRRLEVLSRRTTGKNLSHHIRTWQTGYEDHGATFFFNKTREDIALMPPDTSASMLYYIAFDAPKLQYMSGVILDITIKKRRRILIFTEQVMVLWLVYIFLRHTGLRIGIIHSGMKQDERSIEAALFTNPESDMDILITTYQCASAGLNLHTACCHLILLEAARNTNTMLQAMGRLHRVGQNEQQTVWILFLDHTFDRAQEHNCAKKMVRQVMAEHSEHLAMVADKKEQEEEEQEEEEEEEEEDDDRTKEEARQILRDNIQLQAADKLLRPLLGQSRSRLPWDDWNNLGLKGDGYRGSKAAGNEAESKPAVKVSDDTSNKKKPDDSKVYKDETVPEDDHSNPGNNDAIEPPAGTQYMHATMGDYEQLSAKQRSYVDQVRELFVKENQPYTDDTEIQVPIYPDEDDAQSERAPSPTPRVGKADAPFQTALQEAFNTPCIDPRNLVRDRPDTVFSQPKDTQQAMEQLQSSMEVSSTTEEAMARVLATDTETTPAGTNKSQQGSPSKESSPLSELPPEGENPATPSQTGSDVNPETAGRKRKHPVSRKQPSRRSSRPKKARKLN